MNMLNNVKIGTKLMVSFTIIIVLLLGVAVMGYINTKNINDGMTTMYVDRLKPILDLGQADAAFYKVRGEVYKFIMLPEERGIIEQELNSQVAEVDKNLKEFRTSSLTKEEQNELASLDLAWAVYQKAVANVLALTKAGRTQEALATMVEGGTHSVARKAFAESLDQLITINKKVADELNTQGDVTFANATRTSVVLSAFAVLLAVAIAIALSRSIANPLAAISGVASRIASRDDLSVEFPVSERRDEVGTLTQALRTMIGNIRAATTDIAEGKRLEAELRSSSFYARNLIEASLDPLVTISAEGTITDVNKTTEQVTGVARAQLINSDFSNYFTEPEKARAGYQKVFAEGVVRDYPLTIRHSSGRTTDVLYNASVYKNEAGQVQGVFAAARDITDRKKMDEELRVASLYARNLIEASLDPLVTISAEGTITDVNKTTEQVTGVARAHLIGSDFSEYFTEPDKAAEGYRKVFAEGVVRDYPLTIRHSSGRATDVLYNASVYKNEAGQVQGVFAAARDITDRKKMDNELRTYRDNLEEMVKKRTTELDDVLKEVKATVNVLAGASTEILASTTQVATGTAETSTAIAETTTTVEEVRQAAQLSSQKAKNVADSAQRVSQVGQIGQKAVEEVVAGMEHIRTQMESIAATIVRLSEQTQSIGGIIAAVTDIADQSNLLAVNAAIEATRAGEQGKAFGVVAQEIKSLAEQSKQATLQVRSILSDVQRATSAAVMATEQGSKSVEVGVRQSAQAGEAITKLAESSAQAVQTASQIVASSQQQVVGMDQIGLAMENINKAGSQTATSTTQVETAARSLHEMGQKLKTLVEQFKG